MKSSKQQEGGIFANKTSPTSPGKSFKLKENKKWKHFYLFKISQALLSPAAIFMTL